MTDSFPEVRFRQSLRASQQAVVSQVQRRLAEGERRFHIVAPPRTGRKVLGLYLWSKVFKCRGLVLSPNSITSSQWMEQVGMFYTEADLIVSEHPRKPEDLTSLTYHRLGRSPRGRAELDRDTLHIWIETLLAEGVVETPEGAQSWITDLRFRSPAIFNIALQRYRKLAEEERKENTSLHDPLHPSARRHIDTLSRHGIGLVIFDECHHLHGPWSGLFTEVVKALDNPIVVGITSTPPEVSGRHPKFLSQYRSMFGMADLFIQAPAVVKDGHLTPYQDLIYFARPNKNEAARLNDGNGVLGDLVRRLNDGSTGIEPILDWVYRILAERQLDDITVVNWSDFDTSDPEFSRAARLFLQRNKREIPAGLPPIEWEPGTDEMTVLRPVLDRYVRYRLLGSADPADRELGAEIAGTMRDIGVEFVADDGSPDAERGKRVLAYSVEKAKATVPILSSELDARGDELCAAVLCDFVHTPRRRDTRTNVVVDVASAMTTWRYLLANPKTASLNPIVCTGSAVMVDNARADELISTAENWLTANGQIAHLSRDGEDFYTTVVGEGSDWVPRTYARLVQHLIQSGFTRCIVGTRGLVGEGWDPGSVNVLVDLTTVTGSLAPNRIRGLAIGMEFHGSDELVDIWNVCCIAPGVPRGLEDYHDLVRKHEPLSGIAEDGAVQRGVGRMHASLSELQPDDVRAGLAGINQEMLTRPSLRSDWRGRWRIGTPYAVDPLVALERRVRDGMGGGLPAGKTTGEAWTDCSLTEAIGRAVMEGMRAAGLLHGQARLHVSERAGGYLRCYISGVGSDTAAVFSECLREVFAHEQRPAYAIPRYSKFIEDTWLSRLLPGGLGRAFKKMKGRLMHMHAVPGHLCTDPNIRLAFERAWNQFVSNGKVFATADGSGPRVYEDARLNGRIPLETFRSIVVWA